MSKRFLGVIGVLWGGGILLFGTSNIGQVGEGGAYTAGQVMGWLFGVAIFLAGIYYLAKKPGNSPE